MDSTGPAKFKVKGAESLVVQDNRGSWGAQYMNQSVIFDCRGLTKGMLD